MSEIIDAKVGNPQNSTSKKWANFSQPWNLAFFQDYIFKKYVHFQSQRVPKWKIAHIWQSKEHKNNKITPKNVSQKGLQSLTDVLQHPVYEIRDFLSSTNCEDIAINLWEEYSLEIPLISSSTV